MIFPHKREPVLIFLALLMVGLAVIFLPSVSGLDTLGTFQQNEVVNLLQTCDNCTWVNISSVMFPNSTVAISNVVMTKDGTVYNYSFSDTDTIGTYIVNTYGDDNGITTAGSYTFYITMTGDQLTTGASIVYILFLVAIIFTFLLCFYGAVKIQWNNNRGDDGRVISVNDLKYAKIFLFAISYLLLMFIFGLTKSITENYLYFNGVNLVFNWLFWIMFSALFPLMVLSILFTIITYVKDIKIKETFMRNVPMR